MNETPAPRVVRTVREFTSAPAALVLGTPATARRCDLRRNIGPPSVQRPPRFYAQRRAVGARVRRWSDKRRLLPQLTNGTSAIAIGSVRIRPDRSGYQLSSISVELTGLGELFLLFERLKEKFRGEGLFEIARKRAVPELPRRVALISARGKAMEDSSRRSRAACRSSRWSSSRRKVQGQGAEVEIRQRSTTRPAAASTVIVLTRGGGSYEDRCRSIWKRSCVRSFVAGIR